MRFLIDQCVSRTIVERLRAEGHHCEWIAEISPGDDDEKILHFSVGEAQILITEDWDFGELAIRFAKPAFGIVVVATPRLVPNLDTIADLLAHRITELGEGLISKLTIVEAGRVRQRDLPRPASAEER